MPSASRAFLRTIVGINGLSRHLIPHLMDLPKTDFQHSTKVDMMPAGKIWWPSLWVNTKPELKGI
jgi:hypothetical protein